jgi:hypothetical protein
LHRHRTDIHCAPVGNQSFLYFSFIENIQRNYYFCSQKNTTRLRKANSLAS